MKTWKKWLKRIAATVCAAAMCAAMLPATAFAAEPKTPEPQYTITGFTKERVTEAPENNADGFFHASLLGNDINYDETVNVPTDGTVKLLYKLTVSGNSDALFSIVDEDATIVESNCGANAMEGTIYGDIPDDTAAIIYVTKTFTAEDVADGQLTNTATISGEVDSVLSEDLDGDGDGKYTVTASTPATEPEGGGGDKTSYPGMDKTIVLQEGGTEVDKDTVAAGDTVEFQLESTVPENLKDAITYQEPSDPEISVNSLGDAGEYTLVFHDKMARGLTLNADSIQVMLGNAAIASQYYTITTTGLGDNCTFEVSVNLAKMYNDNVITEQDLGVTPITVTYTATLDKDATAGAYLNEAWVHYPDEDSTHDIVPVYTYGINIFKYDQGTVAGEGDSWTATGLEGAEFELYKAADVTVNGDNVTINEGAEPVWSGTSGEDGYAVINGLDEGTYYLFETKAPDKYAKSDKPLEVIITANADYMDENADYYVDTKFANTLIPHTGGTGTMMYTIGGVAIIVLAGVLMVVYRKSRKKQDR